MRFAYTERAQADIEGVLGETEQMFGLRQVEAYAALIDATAELAAEQPARPSSLDRSDLGPGIRSLHIGLAAGRRRAAAHVIFYQTRRDRDGRAFLLVLRVLHERMLAEGRIAEAMRAKLAGEPR